MILNAYSLLDGFLTLLRLALAVLVVSLAAWNWCALRAGNVRDRKLENRGYLLLQLALLLLALNVLSWPLLYLLLDSYVPQWPGVMCIYGVTRVGAGSHGVARFLPPLLLALQVLKPVLVFASGAWGALYFLNRRSQSAPLMGRMLLVMVAVGFLALVDAALEITYLAIPKHEEFLSVGCCTGASAEHESRFVPSAFTGAAGRPWLVGGVYTAHAAMIAGLLACLRRVRSADAAKGMVLLGAGAVLSVPIYGAFLIDVAAPAWLRLPHHHCPYDLIERAPEALGGVASFVGGTFAVGWACVVAWLGRCPETRPFIEELLRKMLVVALFGYLGSLVTMSVGLALA
jgi:hypothetical protein